MIVPRFLEIALKVVILPELIVYLKLPVIFILHPSILSGLFQENNGLFVHSLVLRASGQPYQRIDFFHMVFCVGRKFNCLMIEEGSSLDVFHFEGQLWKVVNDG